MAIERPNSNPFKSGSKAHAFLELCDMDYSTGFSSIVGIESLEKAGLKTDNGGGWCRSDGPLGNYFNVHRVKRGGRIVSVQLTGYRQNEFDGAIDREISEAYKNENCRVLAVRGKYIEIDHKDGRKQDYKLHDNQTVADFQPMHKAANVAKRQHCRDCTKTGIRFDATQLGYSVPQTVGPEKYNGSCIGCYWHDPKKFNLDISARFQKTR
jgi:hypothetical protein